MRKSLFGLTLFLLLFSVGANALQVNVASNIVVKQEQKDVSVVIANDAGFQQDYSIHFLAPFNAAVSPSFGNLGSGEMVVASLSIEPNAGLEGSAYEGTLEVRLGEELALKKIRVLFKEAAEENQESEREEGFGIPGLAGFYALSTPFFSPGNVLNGFLAVIAGVLLIAFIARFVKRLEGK